MFRPAPPPSYRAGADQSIRERERRQATCLTTAGRAQKTGDRNQQQNSQLDHIERVRAVPMKIAVAAFKTTLGAPYSPAIALVTGNADGGAMGLSNKQNLSAGPTGIAIGSGWNLYQLDANYLGSEGYSIIGTIYSADSTGGITGTIATFNQSLINAELAADSDVYLYFDLNETGGTLDDFSTTAVIPEPSTYALYLGTLATVFIWLRRRKT